MTDDISPPPDHNEGRAFRWAIGLIAMATAISGFAALFLLKVPAENKDAFVFALGSVFGWAGSVIASEYGATATGRKVAESAIRSIERNDTNPEPQKVTVENKPDQPVPTETMGATTTEELPDYAKE